ncbi:MAG: sulfatase-like hydrolase/transferase [Gemmatimonadota bacterium]
MIRLLPLLALVPLTSALLVDQSPYLGAPFAVPGTIQVEDFDEGGEGVAFHDLDATNNGGAYRATAVDVGTTPDEGGGFLVGWTKAGEWLEYTVEVESAGTHLVELRVASLGGGGTFSLDVTSEIISKVMPNTGDWQAFITLRDTVDLAAGQQVWRLRMDARSPKGPVGNFNYFRMTRLGGVAPPPPPPGTRPDIVFILTDDQVFHTLGYMPAVDSLLVRRGVTFTNFTTTTPLCAPSRATELTGQYAHNTGVINNDIENTALALRDSSTIAVWLQRAGYRTGLSGKYINHYEYLTPWPYLPPGWDDWHVLKHSKGYYDYDMVENGVETHYGSAAADYSTDVLTRRAVEFIQSTPAGQPLFLYYAPYAPHDPATPGPLDGGYPAVTWRSPNYAEADVSDKPSWVRKLVWGATHQTQNDKLFANMLRSLQAVDRGVAAIAEALAATGRLDNTVIVFMGDNGWSAGAHRHAKKSCVYEECARSPFVVRAPGVLPRQDDSLVQNIDLAPSLAEWTGAQPTVPLNGRSLLPLLFNPQTAWRQEALIELLAGEIKVPRYSAVRTGQYTYVEIGTGEKELYDRAADPHQLDNVAQKPGYAAVVSDLAARLRILKAQ